MAQHYRCACCKGDFSAKDVQVNHIETVVPLDGFTTWDEFISRLFCEQDKLNVLCKPCHALVTKEENSIRKERKSSAEQATNQCWRDMRQRCLNPNSPRWYTHGGRGITVCPEWDSFEQFKTDMGIKPDGYTLDRVDNDKGYTKENCKWSTPKEQALNRRTNIVVTFNDETLTVSQWAESLGISHSALTKRLAHWPLEKALSKEYYGNQVIPDEVKQEVLSLLSQGLTQRHVGEMFGICQQTISKWVIGVNPVTTRENKQRKKKNV